MWIKGQRQEEQENLGGLLEVVISVGGVGELELLSEARRGRGGIVGKLDGILALLVGTRLDLIELLAGGDLALDELRLEDGDGVRLLARPGLLLLAAALVLGVGGRVAVEAEGVHLEDRGALGAHVVSHGAAGLEHAVHVAAVNLDAGHAVVLALQVHVLVRRHVTGEGVDSTPVVDDNDEKGEALLSGGVEGLGHAAVLRAALTDKHNGDAVVVLELLRIPEAVEQDRARGARGVRQLLRHEGPAALEVGVRVKDVHGAAGTLARAIDLAKELGHDGAGLHARRQSVRVLAVIRILLVALLDAVPDKRGDGLLAVVQVHEAADVALHVSLVARSLELARKVHHVKRVELILLLQSVVLGELSIRVTEALLERRLAVVPRGHPARAHHIVRGPGRGVRGLVGQHVGLHSAHHLGACRSHGRRTTTNSTREPCQANSTKRTCQARASAWRACRPGGGAPSSLPTRVRIAGGAVAR